MSASTANIVSRLEDWFGKSLKSEQYEIYAKRISFIPDKALSDIVGKIVDDNPPTPGRFPTPAKIIEYWQIWKHEHPEMMVSRERTDCHECQGTGFLWARKFIEEMGQAYEFVFRCPYCENWKFDCNEQSPILMRSKEQITAMGYTVKKWLKINKYRPPKGGTNTIAKDIGKRI